jgi:hypothetical protein
MTIYKCEFKNNTANNGGANEFENSIDLYDHIWMKLINYITIYIKDNNITILYSNFTEN